MNAVKTGLSFVFMLLTRKDFACETNCYCYEFMTQKEGEVDLGLCIYKKEMWLADLWLCLNSWSFALGMAYFVLQKLW